MHLARIRRPALRPGPDHKRSRHPLDPRILLRQGRAPAPGDRNARREAAARLAPTNTTRTQTEPRSPRANRGWAEPATPNRRAQKPATATMPPTVSPAKASNTTALAGSPHCRANTQAAKRSARATIPMKCSPLSPRAKSPTATSSTPLAASGSAPRLAAKVRAKKSSTTPEKATARPGGICLKLDPQHHRHRRRIGGDPGKRQRSGPAAHRPAR